MANPGSIRRRVSAQRRRAMRRASMEQVIELAQELDVRDEGSARHCQTVARYAKRIARELDLPEHVCTSIHLAGLLHDVGKVAIPTAILSKRGPLNDLEWAEMRHHPRIGAEILGDAGLEDVRDWVLAHHERPDGKGYPRGLSDEEIPIEAKILAVADAFEAMTTDRIYRKAMEPSAAVAELLENVGTQFDGKVVEAFIAVLDRDGGVVVDASLREAV
jgi:putative nucleotidyltransferase with HDIG domain